MEKEQAFAELHSLLLYYYENRDLPVPKGFDFAKEFEAKCEVLDLDVELLKKELKLV